MTKEKKLEILNRVEEKCYTVLDNLDGPDLMTAEADRLVQRIHDIGYLTSRNLDADTFVTKPNETEAEDEKSPEKPAEHIEKPVEGETKSEAAEAPTYTIDEVRSIIRDKQLAGEINMEEIFETIGYAKLSDVPPEQYPELLKLAGAL